MLALLKSLEAGRASEPAPVQRVVDSSSLMIRNGNPTDECSYEKKNWRRRGRSFQNQAKGAKLTSRLALGKGDFEVSLRLTTNTKVGGSGFHLSLGDLYLYFDSESGAVECWNGWIEDKSRTTGVQLGSIVKAGIPFECVVGREGETISMLLNGKAAVSAKVHSAALGVVTIGAGEAVLGIEAFAMEGSLIEAPRQEILHVARSSASSWYAGQTQLLKTSDEGLLALYLIWQGRTTATVRLNRSRDGGKRWEEGVTLVDPKNSRQMPVWSFSAAANQRRDETWLAYAVGSANHRLYVKAGRNGGRNWTQPVEVTKEGKEAGANVSFAGQGLVVT
ncbi:MAG: exo-alpha-sialidase, partial [Akkermansiaceae bacterium]|nr:exo-alpha-sialidase [Akkermansiaceae bacterium]